MSVRVYLTSKNERIQNLNDGLQMKVSTDYPAELNDFNSNREDETYDWMAAKAEIDQLSQNCKRGSVLLKKSQEVSDYWNKIRAQRKTRITGTILEPKEI